MTTWLFEEGTFVPAAKLTKTEKLSIVTNYMGTPEAMYREDGEAVWTCELNSYGKVRNFQGGSKTDCPFRYQGQYEDAETGLYYNRFRYYSPEEGMYLSQDPIGLLSNCFNFYDYIKNPTRQVDTLGLYNGEGVRELGVYDIFHEHILQQSEFTMNDDYHFSKANESLHQRFETDPAFKSSMEAKYPGISEHVKPHPRGGFSTESPPGTTWHHSDIPGRLELVDRIDHRHYHTIYHPDGEGGRKKWGGGTLCRN
jgi:RHS repeat-associated protein